jgi:hypothetical protein
MREVFVERTRNVVDESTTTTRVVLGDTHDDATPTRQPRIIEKSDCRRLSHISSIFEEHFLDNQVGILYHKQKLAVSGEGC